MIAEDKNQILKKYLPLIKKLVNKYGELTIISKEDLFQEISLILIESYRDYKEEYKADFPIFFWGRVKYRLTKIIEKDNMYNQKVTSLELLDDQDFSLMNMEEEIIQGFFHDDINKILNDLGPYYEMMCRMYFGIPDEKRYYPIAQSKHSYLAVGKFFGGTRQNAMVYFDYIIRMLQNNSNIVESYNYVYDTGIYYPYFSSNFPFNKWDKDLLYSILPYNEYMALKIKYGSDFKENNYVSKENEVLCEIAIKRIHEYFQYQKMKEKKNGQRLEEILKCSKEDLNNVLTFLDPTHHYYDVLTRVFGDDFSAKEKGIIWPDKNFVYRNTLCFLRYLLKIEKKKDAFESKTLKEMLGCNEEEFLEIINSFDNNTASLLKRVFGENYLDKADISWMEQQSDSFYLFWCFDAMMFEAKLYLLRYRKKIITDLALIRKR